VSDHIQNEDKFSEMRRSRRIEYYSKIYCLKYFYGGNEVEPNKPIDIMLINISRTGLGIICEHKFEDNTILVLDLSLEDIIYKSVSAKVIWGIPKGNLHRYGLEICRLSGKLFTHLSKLDNSIVTHI
jgi:hypothetical protein